MQSIKSKECKYYDVCDYTAMCPICKNYKYYFKSKHYKYSKIDNSKMKGSRGSKTWNKKEKEFANNLDAKQTISSGSVNGDGDIKNKDIAVEVKHTDKKYISISSKFITQITREKGFRYGMVGLSNNNFSLILFEYKDNMKIDFDEILEMNKQKRLSVDILKQL